MGRETKILLALLATLAGVFVGVLSMKLLVPRPPAGAGPDVHVDVATAETNELVDPPSLSHAAPAGPAVAETAFSEADPGVLLPPPMPLAAETTTPPPATVPRIAASADEYPVPPPSVAAEPPRRDPFVAPATLQVPIADPVPPATIPPAEPMPAEPMPAEATAAYVAQQGDSWWGLAERAYGDGRLYRALFAWNRVIDPRVSLAPGTRLEIPSRARLEAAWPKLMPTQ